jgi:hypothetical protein
MIAQETKVMHDPKQIAEMGFSEGIGYLPFASIGKNFRILAAK